MIALSDLITTLSPAQALAVRLNFLAMAGFPTSSWQPNSVPLALLNASTANDAADSVGIQSIAAGSFIAAFLPSWTGPVPPSGWLDLAAGSNFVLTRKVGVTTLGTATLTDVGGGGPYTITPGELSAKSTNGLVFTNASGGVVPKNGALPLVWQGAALGSAYNVPNGTLTTLSTPLPGVGINNPDPGTGSWITTSGTDPETDASLATRCTQRWALIGTATTIGAYLFWGVTATLTVTRVRVLENTPTGGQVTIVCAGSSGPATAADVATVAAYIAPRKALCVNVNVVAARRVPITVAGTVTFSNAVTNAANVLAAFTSALTTFSSRLAVGAPVYVATLVDFAMNIPGVQNVAFSNPMADTPVNPTELALLSLGNLNCVGV